MPIKNGRKACVIDVMNTVAEYKPFEPGLEVEIVLPSARPDHREYKGRQHRAYIKEKATGVVLITAPSAYELVEIIRSGWKHQPDKKEGLFEQ